jgi:hypothetical protein
VLGVGGCRLCIVACLSNCPASSAMVIQRILQAPTRALVAWKAPENVKVAIVVLTIIGLTTMKVMGGEQIVVALMQGSSHCVDFTAVVPYSSSGHSSPAYSAVPARRPACRSDKEGRARLAFTRKTDSAARGGRARPGHRKGQGGSRCCENEIARWRGSMGVNYR